MMKSRKYKHKHGYGSNTMRLRSAWIQYRKPKGFVGNENYTKYEDLNVLKFGIKKRNKYRRSKK